MIERTGCVPPASSDSELKIRVRLADARLRLLGRRPLDGGLVDVPAAKKDSITQAKAGVSKHMLCTREV